MIKILAKEIEIGKLKNKLKELFPNLKCIQPKQDAAYGAALRALEQAKL